MRTDPHSSGCMPDSIFGRTGRRRRRRRTSSTFHALSGYIVCKADFPSQRQTEDQASPNEQATQSINQSIVHSGSLLSLPAVLSGEKNGIQRQQPNQEMNPPNTYPKQPTSQLCHPAFSIMPDLASLPPRSPLPLPPRPPPRPPLPLPREEPPGPPPPPPPPPRFPPPPRRLTEKLMRIRGFSTHSTPFKPNLSFSSSAIRQA